MTITFEAVYVDGVLKPVTPIQLSEGQRVHLVVRTEPNPVERTAGLLLWTGDPEILRKIAEDDEFGIMESRW
jgi:predicted DNA-binding antitoxin AbrB/MazE fold protein